MLVVQVIQKLRVLGVWFNNSLWLLCGARVAGDRLIRSS